MVSSRQRVLTEDFVKQRVIKWLTSNRWGHLEFKKHGEHGVDIKARHINYGRYYLIETKGDPDPRNVKYPHSGRETRFMNALGQILTRMDTKAGYYYGIAVPRSYESLVYSRVPPLVCKQLGLRFLLVDADGKVEELTWKEMKNGRT